MRDHGDEYDAIESELNNFIGPKLLGFTVVGYLTGFFIARFILNVQGHLNLLIVSVVLGSNILALCWFISKIL